MRRQTRLILKRADAPHIRYHENTRLVMGDAIISMLIIYAMALYYYGLRAALLMLVSVASAVACDALCVLLSGGRQNPRDLSAIVTGMIIPLMTPATIDYWIVAVAAVFAIAVAKHPFGGTGHNVFNPAAAGFSFIAICFGERLFSYPLPGALNASLDLSLVKLPLTGAMPENIQGLSPAFTLARGGIPAFDLVDMSFGNFPGPMGATNILVLVTCLLYLVLRHRVSWVTPFFFFLTAAAFAFAFPRFGGVELTMFARLYSVAVELMSGMLLFGGVFLLGDPVTTPKRGWSKAAFAAFAGVVAMLFRQFGNLEEGLPFAVLFMNATVWGFDMIGERIASIVRRRRANENISGKKLQKTTPGTSLAVYYKSRHFSGF
jgi:electron transport complex protein RnfD